MLSFKFLSTTPPKISVASPLSQTYNESSVSLLLTSDKLTNWTGYSLDGEQNVTLTGNATLANLTNGLHSLVVFANDTFGNIGASEIVAFTVTVPEPFPTALVITASGASIAVVAAGLLQETQT